MVTRAARNQKAYRDRRKLVKVERVKLVLEVIAGIKDGSNGITCTTSTDIWAINFDWEGEQSAWDVIEVRCNALRFTLGALKAEIEQRTMQEYQRQVKAKHEAQGLKTAFRFALDSISAEIEQEARAEGIMGDGGQ